MRTPSFYISKLRRIAEVIGKGEGRKTRSSYIGDQARRVYPQPIFFRQPID